MGKTLYVECASGISGDMVVAALLDLGASEKGLREALASLGIEGFEIRVSRKMASTVDACDFDVVLDKAYDGHDHDMAYLYGNLDAHTHEHAHAHEDGHNHSHEHTREHRHAHEHGHGHHHVHRGLAEVTAIINQAQLSERARETALRIFGIIAEAEAKAHGTTRDEVHFHEVGAVDSIVDVVAAAWCLDDLDVDEVIVSPLAEGYGRVRCAHGVLPVPVPAVANIVSASGLALERLNVHGELVTPTGAAIAAAIKTQDELPSRYSVEAIGIGVGKRAYDPPSTVRAMLIEPQEQGRFADDLARPHFWKLETEIDDSSGEALGNALEQLYAAGAFEVHYLPVFMKKGRPAYQIELLCAEKNIPQLERVLFEQTTTIGVRRSPQWRTALPREAGSVETRYGTVVTKVVTLPSGELRAYPEHDSLIARAKEHGVSYQEVLRTAISACQDSTSDLFR